MQQWLHECASMSSFTHTASLVLTDLFDGIFLQRQRQRGNGTFFSTCNRTVHVRIIPPPTYTHIPFVYQWCYNLGIWQRHWIKHYPLSPIQPHIIHKNIPVKGFRPEFSYVWRQTPSCCSKCRIVQRRTNSDAQNCRLSAACHSHSATALRVVLSGQQVNNATLCRLSVTWHRFLCSLLRSVLGQSWLNKVNHHLTDQVIY